MSSITQMIKTYKVLISIIFIYAVGHMVYTFFYEDLITSESKMWFFSGGIAMLFNGFLNYIQLKVNTFRLIIVCSNLVLLVFLIFLAIIIPEIQVFILGFIMLVITIVSLIDRSDRQSEETKISEE